MLITIDGYSWSGKSTTANELSKLLGFKFINTGLMYRYLSFCAISNNISLEDEKSLLEAANKVKFDYSFENGHTKVFANNNEITHLSSESSLVLPASRIALYSSIRDVFIEEQKSISESGDYIFEGRDTGSVVFPNADWKFFVKADIDIRIERYYKIANSKEKLFSIDKVRSIIEETDKRDLGREIAPLVCPADAFVYNNTKSPTALQDAMVMFYYISSFDEIKTNINVLEQKHSNFHR